MKSDRTPVFLSAFVYPGAGQFLQRRWIAGLLYSLCFTACFVLFLSSVIRPIFQTLSAALSWAESTNADATFTPVPLFRILVTFVVALALYISNIADAARAARRNHPPEPPPFPQP